MFVERPRYSIDPWRRSVIIVRIRFRLLIIDDRHRNDLSRLFLFIVKPFLRRCSTKKFNHRLESSTTTRPWKMKSLSMLPSSKSRDRERTIPSTKGSNRTISPVDVSLSCISRRLFSLSLSNRQDSDVDSLQGVWLISIVFLFARREKKKEWWRNTSISRNYRTTGNNTAWSEYLQ